MRLVIKNVTGLLIRYTIAWQDLARCVIHQVGSSTVNNGPRNDDAEVMEWVRHFKILGDQRAQ